MCRCRTINDAGCCHSCSHKGEFLSAGSPILFYKQEQPAQSNPSNQGRNSLSRTCFSCGQEGQIFRTCLQRTAAFYPPNAAPTLAVFAPQTSPAPPLPANLPRSLCPRCQKGYHWVRDCRSRFHRNGVFWGPDQQLGNGLRGEPQAPTVIGEASLNPFIPFTPSQNSSELPQAAQDWTSVTPPQQY